MVFDLSHIYLAKLRMLILDTQISVDPDMDALLVHSISMQGPRDHLAYTHLLQLAGDVVKNLINRAEKKIGDLNSIPSNRKELGSAVVRLGVCTPVFTLSGKEARIEPQTPVKFLTQGEHITYIAYIDMHGIVRFGHLFNYMERNDDKEYEWEFSTMSFMDQYKQNLITYLTTI